MKDVIIKLRIPPDKDHLYIGIRFLAELTARASSFVIFPLLVHFIGSEGYGVQAQLGAINGVLIPIATLGLGFAVVRVVAGSQTNTYVSSRFLSTMLLVTAASSLLAGFVMWSAPLVNLYFIKVEWATPVVRWSAWMIVLTAWELTINDYYRARLRIVSYSLLQIFQTIGNIGGLIFVLQRGGGLLEVVQAWLFVKLLFIMCALVYFTHAGEIRFQNSFLSRRELFELVRFGWPIVVMGISASIMSLGDRVVIGYFLNSKQVGIYNATYSLAGIFAAMGAPFWGPLYPLLATYKNNNDRSAVALNCRKYMNRYCLISIPILLGLTILASPLLQALGSSEFAIPPLLFGVIALAMFFDQFSASVHYLVYLHNEPLFMRNIMVLSGIVNLVLNILTIPFWGIWGAALSTLVSYVLLEILIFRRVTTYRYRITELYDFRTITKYAFCASIMAGVVYIWVEHTQQDLKMLVGSVGLGMLCYGGILWVVQGLRTWPSLKNG